MKSCLFFLMVLMQWMQVEAFQYEMLGNATLQSQKNGHPIGASLDSLLEKALANICVVAVERCNPITNWWYGASGSTGFFISAEGHLITAKHSIVDYCNPIVYLSDTKHALNAQVIAMHPTEDVAILKIDTIDGLPYSFFEISSIPEENGDWVFSTRCRGICTDTDHLLVTPSLGKVIGKTGDSDMYTVLSFTAVRGNSGSPVFNLKGSIVGVLKGIPSLSTAPHDHGLGVTVMVSIHYLKDWISEVLARIE